MNPDTNSRSSEARSKRQKQDIIASSIAKLIAVGLCLCRSACASVSTCASKTAMRCYFKKFPFCFRESSINKQHKCFASVRIFQTYRGRWKSNIRAVLAGLRRPFYVPYVHTIGNEKRCMRWLPRLLLVEAWIYAQQHVRLPRTLICRLFAFCVIIILRNRDKKK